MEHHYNRKSTNVKRDWSPCEDETGSLPLPPTNYSAAPWLQTCKRKSGVSILYLNIVA
jgi:hypothetical protein